MAKTYADRAKSIMNKYKTRLGDNFDKGDTLALEAMNQELTSLQKEQEDARAIQFPQAPESQPQFAYGGRLPQYGGETDGSFIRQIAPQKVDMSHLTTGFDPNGIKIAKGKLISPVSGDNGPSDFSSRVPWLGMASGIVGNLLMNKQLDLPEYNPVEYNPTKATANLVDFSRGREQTMSERDQANAMIEGSAKGLGSQNALMENILAGRTNTQRVAGSEFNRSLEGEGNANAQILNQTSQFNAAQTANAAQINSQNQMYKNQVDRENMMINSERKDSKINSIMNSVTGYGKDLMAADQYDNMLKMMTPDNYKMTSGQDSGLKRFFQVSPGMNRTFVNTNDTIGKKELGGLLLFGDDQYGKLMGRINKNKKK